jgi:small GTP-binding protein
MTTLPRIIFVGDSSVGKTSLIYYAKNHLFNDSSTPTIGAGITEMHSYQVGQHLEFQFGDTAGQENYRNNVPIYNKGVSGAILVFSMIERQSFLSLENWIDQLLTHSNDGVPVLVCGNKIDLENQTVGREEAEEWAQEKGYPIIFTSAATGENVDILVSHVVTKILGNVKAKVDRLGTESLTRTRGQTNCC